MNKAYRAGRNLNNPLIPVSVVDDISSKTLAPSQSFLTTNSDSLVLSAVKKEANGRDIIARWYENEGKSAELAPAFLGKQATLTPLNLLEEPMNAGPQVRPYEIRTVRIVNPR